MPKHRFARYAALGSMLIAALILGVNAASSSSAADKPSLKVISPVDGATITTTDIPVTLNVSNFRLSALDVGMANKPGEGHIHAMYDSMKGMATLFNMYTARTFTLPGQALKPGPHVLYFALATNDHMGLPDTMQMVKINYQPTISNAAPAPAPASGSPAVTVLSPADGATVGPRVTFRVTTTNFTPVLGLEGKPNIAGYGHYHLSVDKSSDPMSMAGLIAMPASDTFTADLSAWPAGKHVITIEAQNNDHGDISGATDGVITINLVK